MAKLSKNVWVRGHGWYGPAYPDAGTPPAGSVTNPQCWDGDPPAAAPDPVEVDVTVHGGAGGDLEGTTEVTEAGPPPRSGKGSSDEAWTKYARSRNVAVTEDMKRSEVIAACEAAGVPTD